MHIEGASLILIFLHKKYYTIYLTLLLMEEKILINSHQILLIGLGGSVPKMLSQKFEVIPYPLS